MSTLVPTRGITDHRGRLFLSPDFTVTSSVTPSPLLYGFSNAQEQESVLQISYWGPTVIFQSNTLLLQFSKAVTLRA